MSKAADEIMLSSERLKRFCDELDPNQMRYAVKNTLQWGARKLKRGAGQRLKAVRTKHGNRVEHASLLARENIRGGVSRDLSGFKVGVSARGESYMHKNRKGLKKPAAFWLNNGTGWRQTYSKYGKKHRAGMVHGSDFIGATERAELQGVMDKIGDEFNRQVAKKVKKFGLL